MSCFTNFIVEKSVKHQEAMKINNHKGVSSFSDLITDAVIRRLSNGHTFMQNRDQGNLSDPVCAFLNEIKLTHLPFTYSVYQLWESWRRVLALQKQMFIERFIWESRVV